MIAEAESEKVAVDGCRAGMSGTAWEHDLHLPEDPLPLLVRLAAAHYQFKAIHPFRDGNGRVGRLLIPLMLCAHQRLAEPLLYMSAYFDRNRQQYVDLLLRVSTHGAWREWIAFFVQGVNECAQDSLRLADGLLALRDRYHAAVRTSRASGHLATLLDHLFHMPSITIGQARELLGVTAAAAHASRGRLRPRCASVQAPAKDLSALR